jgi:malonyl-CoA/methylmalonyl-CoA synthetase
VRAVHDAAGRRRPGRASGNIGAMANTLPAILAERAAEHPGRPLLRFEGASWTYGQFLGHVRAAAGALHAWGLRPGERVALYLENSPSFLVAYLAALWCGAAIVPANARYRVGELRHILHDAEAQLVVTDPAGEATLASLHGDVPSLATVVVLSGSPEGDGARWHDLAHAAPLVEPLATDGDALALIAYTSGTTGRSKGAMLSHANLVGNSRSVGRAWRWSADDHLLLALPLFHIHGLGVGFHGTLLHGASATLHRRFEVSEVLADLRRGGFTLFFGVPTMYTRLLAEAGPGRVEAAGLRLLVSGSAPLAPATLERVEQVLGHRILERYGMTETVMLTGNPIDGPRKAGTVGLPFDGVELRVVDPASGTLSPSGEVQVRGGSVTSGYWRHPEATRDAFTDDGWFKTGDLGTLDDDGYLTLTGRARELIIRGGFNVYPQEVEAVIASLPGVREVAVVGLPDADLGERVGAVISVESGHRLEPEQVVDHCRRHLAGYKSPSVVAFVAALPRNTMGKLLRHELRAAFSTSG